MMLTLTRATRHVASALIAGVVRRKSLREVDDWLAQLPPGQRAAVIAGTLAVLAAGAFAAAQWGWIGTLIYWMAVILIVN